MAAEFQGRLELVGPAPKSQLVLTTDKGEQIWLIGPMVDQGTRWQYKLVKVWGAILTPAQGPGRPAQLRLERMEALEKQP